MAHRLVTATIDQPAAGSDWKFVPSTSDLTRLVSITAQLVTSATAATRVAELFVTDLQGNEIGADIAGDSQAASLTRVYSWRPDVPQYSFTTGGTVVVGAMPGFWLPAGAKVGTTTVAIDAGDQWSKIVCVYAVGDDWDWRKELSEIVQDAMAD